MPDASPPPPQSSAETSTSRAADAPLPVAETDAAPTASLAPPPIARPSSPSPSTIPEPALPEPSAAASFGVLLAMTGIISAIVILVLAIIAAGVFAVRSYMGSHRTPLPPAPVAMRPTTPLAPAPPPVIPSLTAPPPPATPPTPKPVPPVEHGPFVASMSPTTASVGDTITLRGRGLAAVEDVILFAQHGGTSIEAAIQSTDDRVLTFTVPAVGKVEGFQPGDGFYIGVFSKTGACLLADSSLRSTTLTDPAGAAHDAVRVKFNSPLVGRDHLLVFGDTGSTIAVGTNCIVLLRPNCVLGGYGGGCKIFYMPPLYGMSPDSDGLIPMTDIRLSSKGSRLMLKFADDPGPPPNPNAP